jgi:hypothetical protein
VSVELGAVILAQLIDIPLLRGEIRDRIECFAGDRCERIAVG